MDEVLLVNGPLDFSQMLLRPLSRPSKTVVVDASGHSYTRIIKLTRTRRRVPIRVSVESTLAGQGLLLETIKDLTLPERAELRKRVRHMFSLEQNVSSFYQCIRIDTAWDALVEKLHGLRPILDADLFESMVRVIVGQQLNVQFAATLLDRLVDLGGELIQWNNLTLPVFPDAEQVASWSYEDLRSRSFSQRKAEYVIDFARTVVEGTLDLQQLFTMTEQEVCHQLMPLRGIGRWTVECFLLFGMGREDVMPAADIGVQNAIQKLYQLPQRPNEEAVRQLAQTWMPWRSYATYYLWQSLIKPL